MYKTSAKRIRELLFFPSGYDDVRPIEFGSETQMTGCWAFRTRQGGERGAPSPTPECACAWETLRHVSVQVSLFFLPCSISSSLVSVILCFLRRHFKIEWAVNLKTERKVIFSKLSCKMLKKDHNWWRKTDSLRECHWQ